MQVGRNLNSGDLRFTSGQPIDSAEQKSETNTLAQLEILDQADDDEKLLKALEGLTLESGLEEDADQRCQNGASESFDGSASPPGGRPD